MSNSVLALGLNKMTTVTVFRKCVHRSLGRKLAQIQDFQSFTKLTTVFGNTPCHPGQMPTRQVDLYLTAPEYRTLKADLSEYFDWDTLWHEAVDLNGHYNLLADGLSRDDQKANALSLSRPRRCLNIASFVFIRPFHSSISPHQLSLAIHKLLNPQMLATQEKKEIRVALGHDCFPLLLRTSTTMCAMGDKIQGLYAWEVTTGFIFPLCGSREYREFHMIYTRL